MKSFNQFLIEAENSIPLDLSEAVEWFSIFDEELSEVDKLEVLEELSEQDLENLSWLKVYISEVIANKISPFTRSRAVKKLGTNKRVPFQRPTPQPAASAQSATTTPQPAGGVNKKVPFKRPTPQPAVSGSSTISPTQASNAGAPTSTPGLRQSVSNLGSKIKSRLPQAPKVPTGLKSVVGTAGRLAGPALTAVGGALETGAEREKGSGWARSLAKGAAVTAGGILGGTLGAVAGGGVGSAALGVAGAYGGASAAGAAFDTVAGANAAQRKTMATTNRQKQAGGGLAGIGGKTTFSKAKDGTGFMSTGAGSQRKTVSLAKTSVVKDPKTGKAETGHLAFKGGQAVYKRAQDPSTLAKTSSNPLERIGRTINPNAYKAQDEVSRKTKLQQAATSDVKRQQSLGVKGSQNLVGPKIVGPKIVGPKIVGPKPTASPTGTTGGTPTNRRGGK
jgi:hypothetical protein